MANYDVESHIPGTEKCFYFLFLAPYARTTRYEEVLLPEGKKRPHYKHILPGIFHTWWNLDVTDVYRINRANLCGPPRVSPVPRVKGRNWTSTYRVSGVVRCLTITSVRGFI